MKLKLTVLQPGSTTPERHLVVTADATSTAGDLAAALSGSPEYEGHVSGEGVTVRVLDGPAATTVAPDQSLLESGVRSGSRIEVVQASADVQSAAPGAILTVVGGPDKGTRVSLPMGSSDIGRASDSDVRLNDPAISKRHARVNVGNRIEVIDLNSSNGVVVAGARLSRVSLGAGDVVRLGESDLMIEPVRASSDVLAPTTDIAFVRSPRVLVRPVASRTEPPAAPTIPDNGGLPMLAMLAPLVMGVVLFAFTRSMLSVVFVGLSPLLMISSYLDQRWQAKRKLARQTQDYEAQLDSLAVRLDEAHREERAGLEAMHPKLASCVEAVDRRTELLWSRRPEHPEFLTVRLGTGTIPALATLAEPRASGEAWPAGTLERARDLCDAYEILEEAPVTADLRSAGGVGVCGGGAASGVTRALVAQFVALHSPAEAVLVCLSSPNRREQWDWLEWLPHTSSPHSPLGCSHLAADPASSTVLLESIEGLVAQRRSDLSSPGLNRGPATDHEEAEPPTLPSVIVLVDQPSADQGRLTRLAEQGPDVGVHFLWCAERRQELPAACRTFVDVTDVDTPVVGMVRSELVLSPVRVESLDVEPARYAARVLTPVVDAGSPVDDESDLPRSVPVVSLLGAEASDDAQVVLERWRENGSLVDRSDPTPRPREHPVSLRALVGHAGTEPFALDLRVQGPHALVGGTTGAGKSEFLQAWVLGLAHALSPDRVTFLFVDYKGGAAFAKCVELPHCVGLVTDLSPHLVRRALRSLRAELHRRERLLNQKRAKDLIELEKTGDPECPPSLIIVIDEFAALKSEVPEFVDGVVDIAQRGRSLGLHLIMATQRPTGVISDNLRANTNLRVALRMADETDSTDVLGSPMAAHFDPGIPGRGAAKTGPGRLATFQSAFPGSLTPAVAVAPPIVIEEFDFGRGRIWRTPTPPAVTGDLDNDITRIVRTVQKASETGAIPPPRKPWLSPLAPTYNLERLRQRTDEELVLGVLDDPDHQAHVVEYYRPDTDGNILFLGAGGSGKTTALRSLAVAAALTVRSGVVHAYGLDFAGGGLRMLESLPHVAPIVGGDDEERVSRLFDHLTAVVDERSDRYTAARADNLTSYRRISGQDREPRILLLVDGFAAMRDIYESALRFQRTWAAFQRLLAEGRAVGVHVAMTADRVGAVPMAIQASFQRRIIMRQADDDAYLTLGIPRDVLLPTSPPGRCVQPENPQELQLAILGTESAVAAQAKVIDELALDLVRLHPTGPEPVRVLPSLVPADEVAPTLGGQPIVGIGYDDLEPVAFEPSGAIVVSGPVQSGRTNAMRWISESVKRFDAHVHRAFVTPRRSSVGVPGGWDSVANGADDIAELVPTLAQLADRDPQEGRRLLLVVEALPELANGFVDQELADLVAACRRNGHLVVAEGETAAWGSAYSALANEVKAARTGILLQPDTSDPDVVRTSLPTSNRRDFPPGRGLWVRGGRTTRVQVPLLD